MSLFAAPDAKDVYTWVDMFIKAIPYAQTSGMLVTALDKGRASLMVPARPTWSGDTERNRIHTGCLSVLADTACGIAVGTALDEIAAARSAPVGRLRVAAQQATSAPLPPPVSAQVMSSAR